MIAIVASRGDSGRLALRRGRVPLPEPLGHPWPAGLGEQARDGLLRMTRHVLAPQPAGEQAGREANAAGDLVLAPVARPELRQIPAAPAAGDQLSCLTPVVLAVYHLSA